ncbi:hypothetical protein B0A52_00840 [Exophiala mesophila]|uniref:Aldehyde dehydrogenase n=1 Tax=Exophiala mesophila TaxID=212818 RepID=A0A438NID0_EXOME|nr:hypothetical protein B0A52_00840 [Exophiala mesophila]
MDSSKLPSFVETPVEDIPQIVDRLRQSFHSQKTRPIEFRLKQLRKLYWAITDHTEQILEACSKDLHKGVFDAYSAELDFVREGILLINKNLAEWVKDEKAPDIAFPNWLLSPRIRKDPLGVVLVIGAFNFPINLSLSPMIGAIAAGNTVVLKPSEQASHCAALMQKIIADSLDPDCYAVVQGAIPQTSTLLSQNWDKIFFTGSVGTAKIVAQAAAKTLTPVALELGGRNPAIVTKKADVRLAARRLMWAKVMNAGQVCISQNYNLVDKEIVPTFVAELKVALKEFYPEGAKKSADYARIINLSSFNRIKKMLDNTRGRILIGGEMDADELYIEPTVIQVSDPEDSLLVDESFGPLFPILPVDNLDQALSIANKVHATPLGVYAFGSKQETDKILAETRSGGATVNDGLFHGLIPNFPFGGVGDSGTGSYRGKASFDCFVHRRSISATPGWMEKLLAVRYPPYFGTDKLKQFQKMNQGKPKFDREGNEQVGTLWYILTLGAGSTTGGVFRATLLAGLVAGLKKGPEALSQLGQKRKP